MTLKFIKRVKARIKKLKKCTLGKSKRERVFIIKRRSVTDL